MQVVSACNGVSLFTGMSPKGMWLIAKRGVDVGVFVPM